MSFLDEDVDMKLDISTPVIAPLTSKQLAQCQDPWGNFTLEEEFYILYDAMTGMSYGLVKASQMVSMPPELLEILGAGEGIEHLRDGGLQAMYLATWFAANVDSIPSLAAKELIQPESSLDADKLKWGRAVRDAISDDRVLTSIWAFRLDELAMGVMEDVDFCAKAEALLFETPPSLFENHVERARINAEKAAHRSAVLASVKQRWIQKWAAGDYEVGADIDAAFEKYTEEHKDELRFFMQRKKATYGRIQKRAEADPEYQRQAEDARNRPRPPIAQVLSGLLGGDIEAIIAESSCGNPDCPVHGEYVRKQMKTQANQSSTKTPTSNTTSTAKTEGRNVTMANDKIKKVTPGSPDSERKFTNVGVQFVDDPKARSISLPVGMNWDEAVYWIEKMRDEDQKTFVYEFKFTGWNPLDAMWATYRAAAELHGFVHVGDFEGWWGPVPPKMITIQTDFGKSRQMPWGPIEIHGLSATLVPRGVLVAGQYTLQFNATIRNKERTIAETLMTRAVELLKTSSIYKGKAFKMDFEAVDPDDFQFNPEKAPEFIDVNDPQTDDLILPESVQRLVEVAIWTPLRKTAEARTHKVPLRRTIMLAGKHGVGKTLTALKTAKIAVEAGWTFLYLKNLKQLNDALYFAQNHQPCLVFAEDIDSLMSGERDEEMNEVLNTVDGIDRKGHEVMLVFTTNHIENIHQGMLRPGRTDTVIPFTPPDAPAVEKLLRLYGRGLISADADLTDVAKKLAGQIPAVIRGVAEDAKLAAIADNNGEELVVGPRHLDVAADQLLIHAELLKDSDPARPDMEVFGEALGRVLVRGLQFAHAIPNESDKAGARDGLRTIIEDANLRGSTNGKHTAEP